MYVNSMCCEIEVSFLSSFVKYGLITSTHTNEYVLIGHLMQWHFN